MGAAAAEEGRAPAALPALAAGCDMERAWTADCGRTWVGRSFTGGGGCFTTISAIRDSIAGVMDCGSGFGAGARGCLAWCSVAWADWARREWPSMGRAIALDWGRDVKLEGMDGPFVGSTSNRFPL